MPVIYPVTGSARARTSEREEMDGYVMDMVPREICIFVNRVRTLSRSESFPADAFIWQWQCEPVEIASAPRSVSGGVFRPYCDTDKLSVLLLRQFLLCNTARGLGTPRWLPNGGAVLPLFFERRLHLVLNSEVGAVFMWPMGVRHLLDHCSKGGHKILHEKSLAGDF